MNTSASVKSHRRKESKWISASVGGVTLSLSVMQRPGAGTPILFLHGFGSTKEDFADACGIRELADHHLIAWDAPGFGQSGCDDPDGVTIAALVDIAEQVIDCFQLKSFHLVGHSMGGLTALLLARKYAEAVRSFINIEGNLAPEDCFLSRQIIQYPDSGTEGFFGTFLDRLWHSPAPASALYAERVRHNVQPAVVAPVFRSMVELSDSGELLQAFTSLPARKMFMFGDANRALSYLADLRARGVQLVEIADCGHFPMYSNPVAMWKAICDFIARVEREAVNEH